MKKEMPRIGKCKVINVKECNKRTLRSFIPPINISPSQRDLVPMITSLVAIGILLVVGFLIASNFITDSQVVTDSNVTVEVQNITQDIPGWIPIIVIVIIGATLLGLVSLYRQSYGPPLSNQKSNKKEE